MPDPWQQLALLAEFFHHRHFFKNNFANKVIMVVLIPPFLVTKPGGSKKIAMDETRSLDNDPQSKAEFKLDELRKRMPPHVFEKSLTKSLMFMVLDFLLWGSSYYGMWHFTHSSLWFDCPCFQKVLLSIFYWFVTGFFMWCIFVVGHDCGHGTFSKYELMNDVFGHLTHGSILVPYYSWQVRWAPHNVIVGKF